MYAALSERSCSSENVVDGVLERYVPVLNVLVK